MASRLPGRKISARQTPGYVDAQSLQRLAHHGSAIVDDWLYIDGGEEKVLGNEDAPIQILNRTLSIDLSSSWTNRTVTINSISKPQDCPVMNFATLWKSEDAKILYSFGGETSWLSNGQNQTYPLSIWSFSPDGQGSGSWREAVGENSTAWPKSITRPMGGQAASGPDTAYYLGGYSTFRTDPLTSNMEGRTFKPLPGILSFNFSSSELTNSSASSYSPFGTAAWGGMHFVPAFGLGGILLALGGNVTRGLGVTEDAETTFRPFDKVAVYEPQSQTWYQQSTAGTIPSPRLRFCIVGAQGNNSYEIFMYGGTDSSFGPSQIKYDEIYVLSLPAFHWFKANYTATSPRFGHTCEVVGNRQLLTIGGVDPSETDFDDAWSFPDPFSQSLGIFDMSLMQWSNSYDASANAYSSPEAVNAYHMRSGIYPPKWDQSELERVMQTSKFTNTSASASSSPSPAPVPPQTTSSAISSTSGSHRTKAIVGGTIGALCGVALILIGLTIWLQRRQSHHVKRESWSGDGDAKKNLSEAPEGKLMRVEELDGTSGAYEMP